MSIIDMTIAVDAVGVIRDNPVSSTTTPVVLKNDGNGYVFDLTYWNDVNRGTYTLDQAYNDDQTTNEGGFTLDIKAAIGDTIRWRMVSLAMGFGYQCFIQSFNLTSGPGVIKPWGHKSETVILPYQKEDGMVAAREIQDYYWDSTVAALGTARYQVFFSVFDSNANRVGIFTIDPYVTAPGTSRYALS